MRGKTETRRMNGMAKASFLKLPSNTVFAGAVGSMESRPGPGRSTLMRPKALSVVSVPYGFIDAAVEMSVSGLIQLDERNVAWRDPTGILGRHGGRAAACDLEAGESNPGLLVCA